MRIDRWRYFEPSLIPGFPLRHHAQQIRRPERLEALEQLNYAMFVHSRPD